MARPHGERPESSAGAEVDSTGKTLVATIETTGDRDSEEHGALAKGSHSPASSDVSADAPTLASGDGHSHGSSAQPGLGVGGKFGRLEIGNVLGDGAFGVVVAAYDPKLKRKLAVKILKPEVFSSAGGEEAQARLLREARAMARIDHANVVTVHDIGTVDGQVFVAMQFVEGNLRTWLTEEKRAWPAIVEKFCQAGRGLAAAHDVGLVHRDFKPDNVLVGKSGEVRVADFGLVSISEVGAEGIASTEFASAQQSEDLEITRAGALMGTALYMAPEQHLGKEATDASDQFAFCVALYWALYDTQPFAGNDYKSLRKHVLADELRPPPTASVPRWLGKVLRKGMAQKPGDRHPSMLQLVALLERDRSAMRRRWLALGAAVLAGAGLTGYLLLQDNSYNPCENQSLRLHGVWDEPVKHALQTSFADLGRGEGFAGLATTVDSYTHEWVSVRTRVCEATHLFGEQSDQLLDQRMLCLDQRLNYLRAFLAELAPGAEAQTLDAALSAASDLPAVDHCTGARVAGANAELPADEGERQAAARLDAHVDRAQALFDLGQQQAAKDLVESVWDDSVQHAPTLARALGLLGRAKSDLGQLDAGESDLRASIEQATVAGDDHLVARSWLALMHLSGIEREDYEAGHQMGELARLAMVRGKAGELGMASIDKAKATILLREGKHADAVARLLTVLPIYQEHASKVELARLLSSLGDGMAGDLKYPEAVDYYRLALANIESSLGDKHPENIYVLNNLAVALKGTGDIQGAREALDKSLLAVETSYGSESRDVVTVLVNLGNIIRREGDLAGAQEVFQRAIRVGKKSFEEGHPTVTKAMMNLAIVYATGEQHALATETFREVLLRNEASFKEDHPDRAMALNNLGEALMLEKNFQEALGYVQRAVEMKGRLYGLDHPRQASSIAALASVYVGLGRSVEAAAAYARALAIYKQALGDEHALTVALYSELGRLHEAEGAAREAAPLLQSAIAGRGQDSSSLAQAEDRFALARAYWASGKRSQARELLDALDERGGAEEADRDFSARLRQWRNTH